MKRKDRKSACPVNFCLEVIGDPWSLLILRDIALSGKHTYKEFLSSAERITTNILADRLSNLERRGILRKEPHATDGRRDNYVLTEKGLDLVPLLLDMTEWGTRHDPNSSGHRIQGMVDRIRREQGKLIREVKAKIRKGGAAIEWEEH